MPGGERLRPPRNIVLAMPMDDRWDEIDHILSQLFELQSRSRVLRYLETGWITAEMADDLLDLLDEAVI